MKRPVEDNFLSSPWKSGYDVIKTANGQSDNGAEQPEPNTDMSASLTPHTPLETWAF